MIRLVRVELTRLRWRRAVVVLVGAAIVVPVLLLLVRAWETRPVGEEERASAQEQVDEEVRYQRVELRKCRKNPGRYGAGEGGGNATCEEIFGYRPNIDNYLYRQPLSVADERGTSGLAVVAMMGVLMLLAGTTYVGHDWSSGSMSNQLLFEPRRLRVWAAKALAVALLAAAVGVVVLSVFWGALLALAQSRGLDPTGQVVTDVAQHGVRGVAMVVAGAVAGYALTTLSRSTVFTIGTLAVVAVAGGLFFGLLGQDALRWEPATNAVAVVNGRAEYYVEVPPACYEQMEPDQSGDCDQTQEVSLAQGSAYYGVLLLALGGASAASYRRRDVP